MPRALISSRPCTCDRHALEVALASASRVLAERRRRQVVAGAVLQVARAVHRLGQIAASATAALDLRRGPATIRLSRCFGGASCVALVRRRADLWRLEAVVGQQRALDERRRDRSARSRPRRPGRSQHSVRVAISRARSRAAAAATRARSACEARARAPSPTTSQRLPSAWVSASDLNERRASPLSRAARRPARARSRAGPRRRTCRSRPCRRRSSGCSVVARSITHDRIAPRHDAPRSPGACRDCATAKRQPRHRGGKTRPSPLPLRPLDAPIHPDLRRERLDAQDRDPRQPRARPSARWAEACPRWTPPSSAGRDRGRARARGRRAGAGRARRHGPGAAGRPGPDPLAPGPDQGRHPQGGLLRDDQQGVRLGRARRRDPRPGDPRGRRRGRRRRRHGVDVARRRTCSRRRASASAWATPRRSTRWSTTGSPTRSPASRCSSRRPRSATSWS